MSETWSHTGFETIARLITARTGIGFETRGLADMERAARQAMTKTGVREPDEFARRLQTGDGVWDALIEAITVGETYFFRNPEHFELVQQRILPALAELRPGGHGLRVWSAGCASGEEAYSLAILLHQQGLLDTATVFGSDLCETALQRAQAGRYRDWSLRGVDRAGLASYLRKRGGETVVSDALRRKVRFARLNLADDGYPSLASGIWEMDLIFCRNVLIYLNPEVVAKIERACFDALAPGGWLVTGPSDPLLGKHAPFRVITTEHGLLYQKPGLVDASHTSRRAGPERPATGAHRLPSRSPARSETTAAADAGIGEAAQVRAVWRASGAGAARTACEKAIAHHALSAELQFLHALVLMDLGANAEAIRAARQCLYLDRSLVMAHFTLAALLRRELDHKGARRAYRTVLEVSSALPPEHPIAMGDGVTANHLALAARRALRELGMD